MAEHPPRRAPASPAQKSSQPTAERSPSTVVVDKILAQLEPDLRGPLEAIMVRCATLMNSDLNADQRRHLDALWSVGAVLAARLVRRARSASSPDRAAANELRPSALANNGQSSAVRTPMDDSADTDVMPALPPPRSAGGALGGAADRA
ncbi:MAG: hypothetical protein AAGC55_24305, partial [Myxococcota bacterium]